MARERGDGRMETQERSTRENDYEYLDNHPCESARATTEWNRMAHLGWSVSGSIACDSARRRECDCQVGN
eukprot:5660096-Pleurochrysis_carterae.AAC.1